MHQDKAIIPVAAVGAPVSAAISGSEPSSSERQQADRGGFTLRRYRVTNFRSVTDSGWLDLDRVTALIGVNESGKTNLLLPLWKLQPAGDGGIEPTSDFPKALFGTIREAPGRFQFVIAEFDTGDQAAALAELARIPIEAAARVSVGRCYDGSYSVSFPLHLRRNREERAAVARIIGAAHTAIAQTVAPLAQADLQSAALGTLDAMVADLDGDAPLSGNDMIRLRDRVAALIPADPPAASTIVIRLRALRQELGERMAEIIAPDPGQIGAVRDAVIERLPAFVYYSNYGNLDSEIYLPHVVENMGRADLGTKESAKARTLRVLFGFVGLQAEEVLQLGRDFRDIRDEIEAQRIAEEGKIGLVRSLVNRARGKEMTPDAQMLAEIAAAKRTRSILLQSAGTKLTERFGAWWKQGDYRFRFESDGNHFRIWVADARRPQEVELENRSTGLQWFLSFFLVFLQESGGEHRNAVLLLDEPGHSLHPLAQRDLSAFFDGLAATNQIVYTTHSPFLVDADRLERARKVFVEGDGSTRVSGDLRAAEGTDSQRGAGFAVHAALNMSVADAMLGGARPVLVGGRIEQIYLSTIKTLLVGAGRLRPRREIVFAPATGPRVMQVMAAMLAGEETGLPPVILDGTQAGREQAAALEAGSHSGCPERVIDLDAFTGIEGAQIEDLLGPDMIAPLVDRVERRPERLFVDSVRPGRALTAQAQDWAEAEGLRLAADWRLQLAQRARTCLLDSGPEDLAPELLDRWAALFAPLDAG
jgi:hypothetical protein